MFLEKRNRKIIPRWRDFFTTLELGELDSPTTTPRKDVFGTDSLLEKRAEWEKHRLSLWHATDFLAAAFVLNQQHQAFDAASFIVANGSHSTRAAVNLAKKVLNNPLPVTSLLPELESREDVHRQIHYSRERLKKEPRNAIAWIELARNHTIVGQIEQASRAVRIACALSPDNRFVLRSAARFLVHGREPLEAHRLLRTASATASDPWLLAAEIGVSSSAGVGPRFALAARKMLSNESLPPGSTTELASALATLELDDGKMKLAKRLFHLSLNRPTENSVAQAEWASGHIAGLQEEVEKSLIPTTYEALAESSLSKNNWHDSLIAATYWQNDQPFSARPAIFGSYLCSLMLENYQEAVRFLNVGLLANPNHPTLVNNMAFALLNMGRTEEAEKWLSSVDVPPESDHAGISLLATRGMLLFRKGLPGLGRECYRKAIEIATKKSLPKYQVMALLYLAREELRASTLEAHLSLSAAVDEMQRYSDRDVSLLAGRIAGLLDHTDDFNPKEGTTK